MFPARKSKSKLIGNPQLPGDNYVAQPFSAYDGKAFRPKALTGGYSEENGREKGFEPPTGKPAIERLRKHPAMQRAAHDRPRAPGQSPEIQRAAWGQRGQLGDPFLKGVVVLFKEFTGIGRARGRIAPGRALPCR